MLLCVHFVITFEHFLIPLNQKDIIHQETDESKKDVGGFHQQATMNLIRGRVLNLVTS